MLRILKYPLVLIKLVEDYNLQDYTLIALGKPPAPVIGNADAAITTITTCSRKKYRNKDSGRKRETC